MAAVAKLRPSECTLGRITTLNADEARKAARDILAAVRFGQNPARERTQNRETPIIREFVERYLTEEAEPKLKPGTVANYRIYFRKHVTPSVGSMKVNAVHQQTSPGCTVRLARRDLLPQTVWSRRFQAYTDTLQLPGSRERV